MKYGRLVLVLALLATVAGCATRFDGPRYETSEADDDESLFGLMQQQGSLDAAPDLTAFVTFQQQRIAQRGTLAPLAKAATQWDQLGPADNLGRVSDIAFDPQNSNVIYIASPGGGIYKSIDGGTSWTWLRALPYQAVGSIAIDPANPQVLYVGTGHSITTASAMVSIGVYKSTDGGATFSVLPLTIPTASAQDWLHVTRVATHPSIPNLVFAGTWSGFFRSTDAGASWTKVSPVRTYDVVVDPNDPQKMLRGRYDGAVSYSVNAGSSWSQTQIVPFASGTDIETRVRYAKSAPGVVYASVNQNGGELYRSADGGQSWSKVSTPGHNETAGRHTNQLWISPADPNHIIVGGVDLYKSLDGGQTFRKVSDWKTNSAQAGIGVTPTTPHADHNALAAPPGYGSTSSRLFVGSDGGLFMADNARTVGDASTSAGWTKSKANFNISQVIGASARRVNGSDTVAAGFQDNGTLVLNASTNNWARLKGGDGAFTAFDAVDGTIFGGLDNGGVFRNSTGAERDTVFICSGVADAGSPHCGAAATEATNFYAPMKLDANSGRLYLGGNSLWMTANPKAIAPTWSAVKAPVAGNTESLRTTNYISAIALAASDPNIVLVGHNDGQVFRTTNLLSAAPTWMSLSAGLPAGRMVGALFLDPEDANRLYVGFAGFNADNLWRSDNGGSTWTNISVGLPPGSIYTITRHPLAKDRLYVGTIWGSYGSSDAGRTWPAVYDGPQLTQIRELFWAGNDTLYSASFGAGVARTTIAIPVELNQHGLTGSWYEPAKSGQGVEVEVFPNASAGSGAMFVSWFTYDSVAGGADRQRWYTAQGNVVQGEPAAALTIYRNVGGNFNAEPPTSAQAVGTATMRFDTCTSGQLDYSFTDGSARAGVMFLTRLTKNVTCSVNGMAAVDPDFGLSGNWYAGPATSGQGFTIEANPVSGVLFSAWYTYAPNGSTAGAAGQRWYTAQGAFARGMRSIALTLYESTGGIFDRPTAPTQRTVAVGSANLVFQSCTAATLTYDFTGGSSAGRSGVIALARVGPTPAGCGM